MPKRVAISSDRSRGCQLSAVAERAYEVYAARYGRSQSLDRLCERGGFGTGELDMFAPGWREHFRERVR